MKRVGLTGGIASGKSVVCEMLRKKGCTILDADRIAHELIQRGQPCYLPVVEAFGSEILDSAAEIDRQRLGALVFGNPPSLQRLNQIVHPVVIRQIQSKLAIIDFGIPGSRVIVEASVMVESGFHTSFEYLILVTCELEQQVERLRIRNGFSEEQARLRIAAQIPLERKKPLADWVIDNSGSLEKTKARVDQLWEELIAHVWTA
jgi:dephospho-CoA kinase